MPRLPAQRLAANRLAADRLAGERPAADGLAPKRLAPKRLAAKRLGDDRLAAIERARAMYAEGLRVSDICAATGLGVGTLYYHLDGHSLPGAAVKRLPRRRDVAGAALAQPSRGRKKLAARLFRAAEQQARKIEMRLSLGYQQREELGQDLQALRELTRVLRDLATLEDSAARAERAGAWLEHEQALAVEGRAVVVTRTRSG